MVALALMQEKDKIEKAVGKKMAQLGSEAHLKKVCKQPTLNYSLHTHNSVRHIFITKRGISLYHNDAYIYNTARHIFITQRGI
jgi:hypothetical protein